VIARPHIPGTRHPTLGWPRRMSADWRPCSMCCQAIPPNTVPLMLFGSGEDAWVYCDPCAEPILREHMPRRPR